MQEDPMGLDQPWIKNSVLTMVLIATFGFTYSVITLLQRPERDPVTCDVEQLDSSFGDGGYTALQCIEAYFSDPDADDVSSLNHMLAYAAKCVQASPHRPKIRWKKEISI